MKRPFAAWPVLALLVLAPAAQATNVACANDPTCAAAGGVVALPSGSTGANPSATATTTPINGSATTYMRSDAAPAITAASTGVAGLAAPANPSATAGPSAINGSATTFMRSDGAPAVQAATTGQAGLTAYATAAQAVAGTSTTTATTPASLAGTVAASAGYIPYPGGIYLFFGSKTSDGSGNISITLGHNIANGVVSLVSGQGGQNITEWVSCTGLSPPVCTGVVANAATGAPVPSALMWYQIIGY